MIYSKKKREKSTTTTGHYVKNAVLLPAVIEAKELGYVTNKLIIMIQMIAERYSRKSNFIGYSFREDMVASAVENLCKNALKFNHEKYNNPFAFYTTAIHNSFLQFLADEKKHRNIRDKMLLDAGANPSFNFLDVEKDESHFEVKESDEGFAEAPVAFDVDGEEKPVLELVDGEVRVVVEAAPKEHKIRYRDRVPGAVVRYGPGDFDIDPVTGNFILKNKEVDVEASPPKNVRAKKSDDLASEVTSILNSTEEAAPKKTRAKKTATA